jgi:hypothetical protein
LQGEGGGKYAMCILQGGEGAHEYAQDYCSAAVPRPGTHTTTGARHKRKHTGCRTSKSSHAAYDSPLLLRPAVYQPPLGGPVVSLSRDPSLHVCILRGGVPVYTRSSLEDTGTYYTVPVSQGPEVFLLDRGADCTQVRQHQPHSPPGKISHLYAVCI